MPSKPLSSFLPQVFIPSIAFIFIITLVGLQFPQELKATLQQAQHIIFTHFSWFYVASTAFFLLLLIVLASSRLGHIKLGNQDPDFSLFSWLAMLFSAGMGVGLMYFGTAEPILHTVTPLHPEHIEQSALLYSIFHWGLHPWAIYGVTALALAYFAYQKNLPLSLRSTFYPLLKERIYGGFGHLIDILSLLVTLFGIATTLGFSSIQLNAGLFHLQWLDEMSLPYQILIIVATTLIATASVLFGLQKGLRRLSELNILCATLLLIFIFLSGPSSALINAFIDNINTYLGNITNLSLKTFFYEKDHQTWFQNWTILYWAWWFSWAPFVGLFIARISRGRTIREFVLGILLVPTTFSILWFTVFGNSALMIDQDHGQVLSALADQHSLILFKFLEFFPISSVSIALTLFCIALFFITSADSGIFVLNGFASAGQDKKHPAWQNLFWSIVLMSVSIALIYTDGLAAIQAMNLIITLFFVALLVLMAFNLIFSLKKTTF